MWHLCVTLFEDCSKNRFYGCVTAYEVTKQIFGIELLRDEMKKREEVIIVKVIAMTASQI